MLVEGGGLFLTRLALSLTTSCCASWNRNPAAVSVQILEAAYGRFEGAHAAAGPALPAINSTTNPCSADVAAFFTGPAARSPRPPPDWGTRAPAPRPWSRGW